MSWIQTAVAGAIATFALPAHSQQSANAPSLDEALEQIEALKKQVADLEALVKSNITTAPPTDRAANVAAPTPPPDASPQESESVKWNELTLGKSRFKLYGHLRLDAIYDDSHPNNTQIPAYIRSEDPAAPAAIGAERNAEDLTIHPRLSRFGIDFFGPEISALGGAKVTGKGEIDFYSLPSSESRNVPRMRHVYLKLDWDDYSFLAGQTSDVISPLFPTVNPDLVMWGAGNLGDRRPQFRGEWRPKLGPGALTLQAQVGLTGADDAQDLDPAGAGGFRDGESSGKPTLQARAAYAFPLYEKQRLELGLWGHRAWERTDTPIGANLERDFDSEAVGLDLTVPLYKDIAWLKGELWTGRNLSDIRGGILQGINTATGREVDASGGWIELGVRPTQWFSVHAGHSIDDPDDSDLAGAAVPGRTKNSVWYGAIRGYFGQIEVGMDYLNWTTDWAGFGPGEDNRFQWFVSYKF